MSRIAEKKFPYETEKECKDEFTRNLRNGIIDLLRQTFDLGMEYKEKELMKLAVEGEVNVWCSHISLPRVLPSEFSKQRVKVIIIKE